MIIYSKNKRLMKLTDSKKNIQRLDSSKNKSKRSNIFCFIVEKTKKIFAFSFASSHKIYRSMIKKVRRRIVRRQNAQQRDEQIQRQLDDPLYRAWLEHQENLRRQIEIEEQRKTLTFFFYFVFEIDSSGKFRHSFKWSSTTILGRTRTSGGRKE